MNFIEAIRAKKAIRRRGKADHYSSQGKIWVDPYLLIACCASYCEAPGTHRYLHSMHLAVEDILADDWETYKEHE